MASEPLRPPGMNHIDVIRSPRTLPTQHPRYDVGKSQGVIRELVRRRVHWGMGEQKSEGLRHKRWSKQEGRGCAPSDCRQLRVGKQMQIATACRLVPLPVALALSWPENSDSVPCQVDNHTQEEDLEQHPWLEYDKRLVARNDTAGGHPRGPVETSEMTLPSRRRAVTVPKPRCS